HPVVVAPGQVLFPSPVVFHGQQLFDVRPRVDHRLVVDGHSFRVAVDVLQSGRHGSSPDRAGGGHWQASQLGSSTEQAVLAAGTAFSFPSVPRRVLFSTWVAATESR